MDISYALNDMEARRRSNAVVYEESSYARGKVSFWYPSVERVPEDVVNVRLHSSVTTVTNNAFHLCKDLKKVLLNEGLVKIGSRAFEQCTSLESITLPSTVTDIGNYAFSGCRKLKNILVCSEGLEKIGMSSFAGCTSLQSITLPSTVTEIGPSAFSLCGNLKEVVLNEGLEKIEDGAFVRCKKLETIRLPSSLALIGNAVFKGCCRLREVVCMESLPNVEYNAFQGCSALERITFPNLSSRLEDIIQAGQVDIQNKIRIQQNMNRGDIEWRRGGTISIPNLALVEVMRRRDIGKELKQRIDQIVNWIKYYEMKEATTIFELALWKVKIDQVGDDMLMTRDECRLEVPGPVKDAIMQYLL